MDKAKVENAFVCGMPFLKKWSQNEPFMRPRYYLDSPSRVKPARDSDVTIGSAIIDFQLKYAGNAVKLALLKRVHPTLCGFDATDLGAVDLLIKRIKEFPAVWEGVGEVMSRHDDLTNLTTGERPRANHPALARVGRFAGEHYLPISIHHNIAPISRNADEVKPPYYLNELVQLIEYCRAGNGDCEQSTTFIWCHSGISRRIVVDNLHFWIDEMLANYGDQLYIDLSWVVFDDYVLPNLEAWVKLIERYPDRFMIGSDVVGIVSGMDRALRPYDQLLEALPRRYPPQGRSRQFRQSLSGNGSQASRRRAGRKRNRPTSGLRILREGPRSPAFQGNPIHGRAYGKGLIEMKDLAGSVKYQAIQNVLRRELFDHLAATQDPRVVGGTVDWGYYPHYGNRKNKTWKVEEKP